MKIRTDYVSNSSSSSFVLLGKTMTFDKFVESVKAAGFKSQCSEDDEYYVDFWEIKDWIVDKTKGFIDAEASGEAGDYEDVVVGVDPSKMNDIDTLKDFKNEVISKLETIGIDAKLSDIEFTSGGSDASGMSFIESCG